MLFRSRLDELNDLIMLFEYAHTEKGRLVLLNTPHPTDMDNTNLTTVIDFVKKQIEELSAYITEVTLGDKVFAFDFAERLSTFDNTLFEKVFQSAVTKHYSEDRFNEILQIVRKFKYFSQAIVGYKAIYNELSRSNYDQEKTNKLAAKLQEMCGMKLFAQLPENLKSEVEALTNRLSLQQ